MKSLSVIVNDKSTKKVKYTGVFGWEDAVKDAERQIQEYEARIEELKAAIRVCKRRARAGEPWPARVPAR